MPKGRNLSSEQAAQVNREEGQHRGAQVLVHVVAVLLDTRCPSTPVVPRSPHVTARKSIR